MRVFLRQTGQAYAADSLSKPPLTPEINIL